MGIKSCIVHTAQLIQSKQSLTKRWKKKTELSLFLVKNVCGLAFIRWNSDKYTNNNKSLFTDTHAYKLHTRSLLFCFFVQFVRVGRNTYSFYSQHKFNFHLKLQLFLLFVHLFRVLGIKPLALQNDTKNSIELNTTST